MVQRQSKVKAVNKDPPTWCWAGGWRRMVGTCTINLASLFCAKKKSTMVLLYKNKIKAKLSLNRTTTKYRGWDRIRRVLGEHVNNAISPICILVELHTTISDWIYSWNPRTCKETVSLTSVNLPEPSTSPQEVGPLLVSPLLLSVATAYKWGISGWYHEPWRRHEFPGVSTWKSH